VDDRSNRLSAKANLVAREVGIKCIESFASYGSKARKEGPETHVFNEVIQGGTSIPPNKVTIDSRTTTSVHLSDKLVDVRLPVTEVTALNIVLELARSPSASGIRKFKWPEEVRHLTRESACLHNLYCSYNRLACLKLGPTVKISCTRSSTDKTSYLPRVFSMTELVDKGIR
jgi:hypothetical protein